MKFNHWVKHNDIYYMPGEEVPIEEPKPAEKKVEKEVVSKKKTAK